MEVKGLGINTKEERGITYINTSPHIIRMRHEDGTEFIVEPSGVLINARPIDKPAYTTGLGVEFVVTEFVPSEESERMLDRLEEAYPGAVILGSAIAVRAFPGRVSGLIPVKGFERVAPEQKVMQSRKFYIAE